FPTLKVTEGISSKKIRCTDLAYLKTRTKSNPALMMEMISLYLEQTPTLISAMNKGFADKDWISLHAALHKMIPSFSIVGLNIDYLNKANKVQAFSDNQLQMEEVHNLVVEIAGICEQACQELEVELNRIKKENG
ncbi:MAG: hybrid sensor histidine kinase/response regulator, partial [Bacteroidia bacterium]|nr:hybrid sensor histidine kinase/response regulator [Bacteroidia bacterium]